MFVSRAATLLAALLITAFGAAAQKPGQVEMLSPAQSTEDPSKVEVIEFFWYGCPHCYAIEPSVRAWLAKLPKDVTFKRVHPAIGGWEPHAEIYYTLETMGLVDQLQQKVFDAIHKENVNLTDPKVRTAWLAKQGVDPAKYDAISKSFTVATKLNRARQMAINYKVDSVPKIVIDGKYVVPGEISPGVYAFANGTVDQVIAMARKTKVAQPATAAVPAQAKK
jgi:protein dithiol oxidoreductase (disulfide-forming)